MRKVLLEGLLVACLGMALSFVANGLSPRGLSLGRNYFPHDHPALSPADEFTNPSPARAVAAPTSTAAALASQIRELGFHFADSNEALRLFHDPGRNQNLILFIDARDEEHYRGGHIPGAYEFDRYYPDKYLSDVLPACQLAQQILVYCNGGECEDSKEAASFLAAADVPKEKLFVYGGGITEWSSNGLPIEVGARNSGDIQKAH